MPQRLFETCIPTRSTIVPSGRDWIHEIKHDGYRLIVRKDHKRVRLYTRNGHDWTDHYPLIVEAALRNRSNSFVIEGEAVLLGVDGISDFDGLHTRQHDDEVSSTPSTCWPETARTFASFHYRCEKPTWPGFSPAGLTGFLMRHSNRAPSGRISFARPALWAWKGWFRSAAIVPTAAGGRPIG
jgi:hypothetical protein